MKNTLLNDRVSPHGWRIAAAFFAIIFLSSCLGVVTRSMGHLAAFWPANAILLGLLVRHPRFATPAAWMGAVAGYVVADLMLGGKIEMVLLRTTANMVGVAVGYLLFRRLEEPHRRLCSPLASMHLVINIVVASVAAGAIGAMADHHEIRWHGGLHWFMGELANYMALLPVILSWPKHRFANLFERRKETAASSHVAIPAIPTLPLLAMVLSCLLGALIGGPGAIAFPVPALLWCALSSNVFWSSLLGLLFSTWTLTFIAPGYLTSSLAETDAFPPVLSLRFGVAMIALAPLTVATVMSQLKELLSKLQYVASHDQLTSLINRRAFYELGAKSLQQSAAAQHSAAVLMLDIDHFKSINDRYGHAGGDKVLVEFARVAATAVRDDDLLARLGGEEFAVLLDNCNAEEARLIAQRICDDIASAVIDLEDGVQISITVSIGVVFSERAMGDLEELLLAADTALYHAKNSGRNRVESRAFDFSDSLPAGH